MCEDFWSITNTFCVKILSLIACHTSTNLTTYLLSAFTADSFVSSCSQCEFCYYAYISIAELAGTTL